MNPVPDRTPEEPLPEMPSPAAQGLGDIAKGDFEVEVSGAEANSENIVPLAPAHRKRAPLPHAPKARELPPRRRP